MRRNKHICPPPGRLGNTARHDPSQRYLENRRVSLSLCCNPSFPVLVLIDDLVGLCVFVHLEFLSALLEYITKGDSCLKLIAWFDPRLASEESGPGRDALDLLRHQNKNTARRSDYSAHSGIILCSARHYCAISIWINVQNKQCFYALNIKWLIRGNLPFSQNWLENIHCKKKLYNQAFQIWYVYNTNYFIFWFSKCVTLCWFISYVFSLCAHGLQVKKILGRILSFL